MKLWTGLGLLAGFCAATSTSAVVLFQNGFEAGSPGDFFVNSAEGYSQSRFGETRANYIKYRGSINGVVPSEGARMLEWTSPALPGGWQFYHTRLGTELYMVRGQHRFMQASIKFWVGSGDLDDKELTLDPLMHSTAIYRTKVRLKSGDWRTETSDNGAFNRSGTTNLHRSGWNTLRMTHDFELSRMNVSLNDTTMAETPSAFGGGYNDKYFERMTVTLAQLSDVSSICPVDQGGPVMYLDDYRVDAVPEPGSILSLATLCFGLRLTTRRPKAAG